MNRQFCRENHYSVSYPNPHYMYAHRRMQPSMPSTISGIGVPRWDPWRLPYPWYSTYPSNLGVHYYAQPSYSTYQRRMQFAHPDLISSTTRKYCRKNKILM